MGGEQPGWEPDDSDRDFGSDLNDDSDHDAGPDWTDDTERWRAPDVGPIEALLWGVAVSVYSTRTFAALVVGSGAVAAYTVFFPLEPEAMLFVSVPAVCAFTVLVVAAATSVHDRELDTRSLLLLAAFRLPFVIVAFVGLLVPFAFLLLLGRATFGNVWIPLGLMMVPASRFGMTIPAIAIGGYGPFDSVYTSWKASGLIVGGSLALVLLGLWGVAMGGLASIFLTPFPVVGSVVIAFLVGAVVQLAFLRLWLGVRDSSGPQPWDEPRSQTESKTAAEQRQDTRNHE